jgi:hypothetical protein
VDKKYEHETERWYVGAEVTHKGAKYEVFDVGPVMSPLTKPGKPVYFHRMRAVTLVDATDGGVTLDMIACIECDTLGSVGEIRAHLNMTHGNGNYAGRKSNSEKRAANQNPKDFTLGEALKFATELVELRVRVDAQSKEITRLNERLDHWKGRAKTAESSLNVLRGAMRQAMGDDK